MGPYSNEPNASSNKGCCNHNRTDDYYEKDIIELHGKYLKSLVQLVVEEG